MTFNPPTLPERLISKLQHCHERMQMQMGTALAALKVIREDECEVEEFVALAEHDIKLASDILCLANSSLYRLGVPCESLPQAVVRLGLPRTKKLTMACVALAIQDELSLEDEWISEVLRVHATTTGAIATKLNTEFELGFDGEELATGLLHDIGRLLLASALGAEYRQVDRLRFEDSANDAEIVRDAFGAGFNEVSAWFAHQNYFPDNVVQATLEYCQVTRAKDFTPLTTLLCVADDAASHFQRFGRFDEYQYDNLPAVLVENEKWLVPQKSLVNFLVHEQHMIAEIPYKFRRRTNASRFSKEK